MPLCNVCHVMFLWQAVRCGYIMQSGMERPS